MDLKNIKDVKELMKFFQRTELHEIELEIEGDYIRMQRSGDTPQIIQQAAPQLQPAVQQAPVAVAEAPQVVEQTEVSGYQVKSPLVGTFYGAPNPDSSPFVEVGKKVSKGDTLCILEAMKIMNEIEAPVSGTVVKVLVNNEDLVEYDQPLFIIDESK